MIRGDAVHLRQVVLDSTDARTLAEFYRDLLGWTYRAGDEPPPAAEPDPLGRDWLVLRHPSGGVGLAFQQVDEQAETTWPDQGVPQQLHLDLTVSSIEVLDRLHDHALTSGARLRLDRSHDDEEPLRVYADPDGHPFCIFVAPDP